MPDRRTAIVTGGSQGIGAQVCRRLAADGFAVVVGYGGSEGAARTLVEELTASGGSARAVQGDVGVAGTHEALFDAAAELGTPTALVSGAGIMRLAPLAESTEDDFDAHVATNLKGAWLGIREAARRLGEGGRVVTFSSSVVGLYQPTYATYAATKGGVEALTHVAAKELGRQGITVNAVAPGPVATSLFLDGKTDEQVSGIAAMIPLGRLAEPTDIASVVSFLVGPDGGWVNGQVLRANGGVV